MWYLIWVLGILLACAFAMLNALRLDRFEAAEQSDSETK